MKVGLAGYAVPRFVRVIVDVGEEIGRAASESVGSEYVSLMMKKLKTGLRREGFAPGNQDRMWWVEREGGGFVRFGREGMQELRSGKGRL